jgi:hypothetical protein
MGAIDNTLELMEEGRTVRPSRWPFVHLLYDPDRTFESVQIGWIFVVPFLTVLRIEWPLFLRGTAITSGEVEKAIVISFFGREWAVYR